jgi:transmembrane sensor
MRQRSRRFKGRYRFLRYIGASLLFVAGPLFIPRATDVRLVVRSQGATLTMHAVYTTGKGEHIRRMLPDRTVVDQNTSSVVQVALTSHSRELILEDDGELVVSVAPDQRGSFVVRAGALALRAVSATVWVKSLGGDVWRVAAISGSVEVRCAAGGIRLVSLRAGDSATFRTGAVSVNTESPDDLIRKTAWREDQIWFSGETLAEAAAEFNRYNDVTLVIEGRRATRLRVGGHFRTRDVDRFVRALSALRIRSRNLSAGPRSPDVILLSGA